MTGPNLTRAFAPFAATGTMYAVCLGTGKVIPILFDQYQIMNASAFDGYAVKTSEVDAYAEQARVLAEIAGRN